MIIFFQIQLYLFRDKSTLRGNYRRRPWRSVVTLAVNLCFVYNYSISFSMGIQLGIKGETTLGSSYLLCLSRAPSASICRCAASNLFQMASLLDIELSIFRSMKFSIMTTFLNFDPLGHRTRGFFVLNLNPVSRYDPDSRVFSSFTEHMIINSFSMSAPDSVSC